MSTDPGSQAEVLRAFEHALELDGGERVRFLGELVVDVRREVVELLALEESGGDLGRVAIPAELVTPGGVLGDGFSRAKALELQPGTRIGSFTIEAPLGAGGMGRVYVAVQDRPHRRVALKTLRTGLESAEAVRRFQVEAELLAHVHHPGIAEVYEAGVHRLETEAGELDVPYLAMELLDGARPIVVDANERELDLEARVRLFVPVCRAVHHAHLRGVIHRDLKPGNVLVDGAGAANVIDFGVAHAAELDLGRLAGDTRVGQLLGTPGYMSPEQLELAPGEIDLRTDVYALGALLYELACGRTPFDGRNTPLGELARRVVAEPPPRPSRFVDDLPPDLEAVILKALRTEREDRYGSAALLADDLDRFLRREPVEARGPSALHRARLFARRNPALTGALALFALTLVGASVVSTALAVEARRAQGRAENAQRAAESAQGEAEAAQRRAEAFLDDLFEASFELVFGFSHGIARLEGSTELRVAMLRRALDQLAELEDEARARPAALARLVAAYVELGDALGSPAESNVGDLEGAELAYARAQALLDDVPPDRPDVWVVRVQVLIAQGRMGRARGRFDVALERSEEACDLLRVALEDNPDDERLRAWYLSTLRDTGHAYGSLGEHERALAVFEELVAGRRALLEADPTDVEARGLLANALSSEATARFKSLGAESSLDVFRESVELADSVAVDAPGERRPRDTCVALRYAYTEALIEAGELDEALDETARGLEYARSLAAGDPTDVYSQRWVGLLSYNAAWAHHRRARLDLGAETARDDLEAARDAFLDARDVFQQLAAGGALLATESDHVAKIEDRLARVEADLAAE